MNIWIISRMFGKNTGKIMNKKNLLVDANVSGLDGIGRATNNILNTIKNNDNMSLYFNTSVMTRKKTLKFESYIDKSKHYTEEEIQFKNNIIETTKPDILHSLDYRIPFKKVPIQITTIYDIFRYTNPILCYTNNDFKLKYGEKSYFDLKKIIYTLEKITNHKNSKYYSLHHQYYSLYLNFSIQNSNTICVSSNYVKDQIQSNFSTDVNVTVIPLGINHLPIYVNSHKNTFQLPEQFITYVGQYRSHKNVDILLKIMLSLVKRNSSIKLLLIGKDFEVDSLFYLKLKKYKSLLNGKIILMGAVSDKLLQYIYKHTLGLIHLSSDEGFGFTPLEAFSYGCPVIASNDNLTILNNLKELAYYVHPDDVNKITSIILELKNDSVKNRKKRINQAMKFTWENYTDKLFNLYKEFTNE